MSDAVQEFLKAIGPRKLTDEEARQLHLLRIREGHDDGLGFIQILAERARIRAGKGQR